MIAPWGDVQLNVVRADPDPHWVGLMVWCVLIEAYFEPENLRTTTKRLWQNSSMPSARAKAIAHKPRPRGENVLDLIDALKKSLATAEGSSEKKPSPSIANDGLRRETAKAGRSSARRKAG
jgi:DNA end-binding protein Ku